jgi:PAS domain S-box-containing protein
MNVDAVPRADTSGRVLVIEEDDNLRLAIRFYLEQQGWTVEAVSTGTDGIDAALRNAPDVITLDIDLVDMDGREALACLKSDAGTSWIPVVILSAGPGGPGAAALLHAGAQDYMAKPFSSDELGTRLGVARRVAAAHRLAVGSESRFRLAFDAAPVGIAELGLDGRFLRPNPALCQLLGYTEKELGERTIVDISHPEDTRLVRRTLKETWASDDLPDAVDHVSRQERRYITASGGEIQCELSAVAMYDDEGRRHHILAHFVDITERKVHERVLADERRRLHTAEVVGHIGSWEMRLDSHLVTWSDTLFRLFGLNPGDGPKLPPQSLNGVHPDDLESLRSALDECEHSGTPILTCYRSIRPSDGELRWFEVRGERITDGEGPARLTGSVIDVSDQVWAREILESARDDALAASVQKSSFLANMSHEIRTPMNGVIGMTGLLLDTPLSTDQRDFVETIRGSGEALLTIINDILDFSKIESGQLDLERHPFDLRECMDAALAVAVAAAANTNGIELLVHLDDRCPPRVLGDVTRLRQVLVNLVGNAMKFTEHGYVLLTVEPDPDRPTGDAVRVAVADTGIGIPADRLGSLFDSYSQVDSSTTRIHGGTGLGLAISDRLVRAMGGTLGVESVMGQGSTFSFSVELSPVEASIIVSPPNPGARLKGHRVLMVDDNPINRRIVRYELESWGMRVTDVGSGAEALALVESGAHFDVALVDMKMPQMTGEDLAVSLSRTDAGRAIPLILVSAWRWQLTAHDLFSGILTKPTTHARLRDSLLGAIWPDDPRSEGPHQASEWVKKARAMRVLLVEDNTVNQHVGRLILEKLGHCVDLAANGLEAVNAVDLVPYDAVFMDVQMPEMNGLDATALIRARPLSFRQPYVIALTASATVEDQQKCLEAGMDEFLTKPVRIDHFRAALERADAYGASATPVLR